MDGFLVPKDAVPRWIHRLAQKNTVYFPQSSGRSSLRFKRVREGSEIQFDRYHPTLVPPGKKLAPTQEILFRYRKKEGDETEIEPVLAEEIQILAGVRPCDLKGIHLMDQVNQDGYGDPHYQARRAHTILIGHDCLRPCDGACFCDATGSLHWRQNADIFLTSMDHQVLVEIVSERGRALLQGSEFPVCKDVAAQKARAESLRANPFGRQLAAPVAQLPALLARQWQSPIWSKHVEHCFSCGTCNLVCPTCYCFNVEDDFHLTEIQAGQRTRSWDSCMLPKFSEVAGGHNFRPQPEARQRHRVKRKFEYLTHRFEEGSFCVGCGRCGRQCTADIDIFDIVNDLVTHAEAMS
ncbi:MAG: 4Fe-4S dicluster domain-containing protein [Magnetococcales bacterium]|nr:4Fe-4S dicluster domain-containing protein [Magnetococcales bacterium]